MAVVIRLQRTGKPKQPYFRVVAIDKKNGPRGRPLEVIGHYNPRVEKATERVVLKVERYDHWVNHGALPSDTVASLVKKSGLMPAKSAKSKKSTKSAKSVKKA